MGARNGSSIFDLITNGWKRKLFDRDTRGSLAVGIPADYVDEHGLEPGDNVAIRERDGGENGLELYFES